MHHGGVTWLEVRSPGFWLLCLSVLFMIAGCASMTPEDSETWRASQSKKLMERAEARWKALIAGDYEKAYQYQSPGYRAVASLQQFKASFGRVVDWRMARVENIQYDDPSSVQVFVALEYAAGLKGKEEYRSVRVLPERWLYSEGNWWYVSTR